MKPRNVRPQKAKPWKVKVKKKNKNKKTKKQQQIETVESKTGENEYDKFPAFFFVQASKIVVDSWKISMLLLYVLLDDWPIFMISASNEQLQQQLEYTLLNPDCHIWWISKIQSVHEDT